MTFMLNRVSKSLARISTVLLLAASAGACSSLPGWVDPTTWIGGDSKTASDQNEQTAENGQTPDIASVPDKPAPASTAEEQKDVTDSLAADRTRNQYSTDALRGGTEAAAAPPPDAPPPAEVADTTAGASAPAPSADQGAPNQTAPSNDLASGTGPQPPASADNSAPADQGVNPAPAAPQSGGVPGTLPAVPARASTAEAAPPSAAPTQRVAMNEAPAAQTMPGPAAGAIPAVPATVPGVSMGAIPQSDDLGFQRSSAPPLDPSVAQFVPQPILARYQQTASLSGTPGVQSAAVGSAVPANGPAVAPQAGNDPPPAHGRAMGGPEQMTGAVVANFDSLQTASVAPSTPSVYANPEGLPPAAVVFFPHDTTVLSASAKAQVREAAQAYQSHGGQGYIRVVGHSSSRTANMPLERHLVWNFERSQARAKAVAEELIRQGVPADKVLVEAVGDSQPVYYESMPQGEEGNRRAEIFFQS